MTRLLSGRALLAALVVLPMLATAAPASAADALRPGAVGDEPVDREIELARLSYQNGVRVTFTRDAESGDWGLREDGQVERNAPLVDDDERGMLAAYLSITPASVPVPRELLAEPAPGTPTPPELAGRSIASSLVVADDLAVPSSDGTAARKITSCWDLYFDPYHWAELPGYPVPASVHHPAKTYYSADFGGRALYAHSYLANCNGGNAARHRIYYRQTDGDYVKHHDFFVPSWTWQKVTKGSVYRFRAVLYDGAWGDTRNGKYTG
ncbi:hypothetical protein E0H26_14670 [Micromonospora zingiberis]|uniref:Secreted protein n=1 Tax=Micromonospora zingiberis TaxID=2053011 RepID=A0A4R0GI85_9ACTN|nr:hypothetical protein [Micromonospora zingiberis]TCB96846.1 hypothetical protein E0H26_14670 [Micromonospora zingiberis]